MSIQNMSLAEIFGDAEKADDILFKCAMTSNFHPCEPKSKSGSSLILDHTPYEELVQELLEVSGIAGFDVAMEAEKEGIVKQNAIKIFTKNLNIALLKAKTSSSPISAEINGLESALKYAKKQSSDETAISIGDIFACESLSVGFGSMPVSELSSAISMDKDKIIFVPCETLERDVYAIYFTPNEYLDECKEYLENNGFVHIWIPAISIENTQKDLSLADEYILTVKEALVKKTEKRQNLIIKIDKLKDALKQLSYLDNLPISLDEVLSCKYLKMHFGKLPHDGFLKLPYLDKKSFFFHELSCDEIYHWGIYITTLDDEEEADKLFDSLNFERIDLPNFVGGVPENAEEELEEEISSLERKLSLVNSEIEKTVAEYRDEFINLYIRFDFLKRALELRKYLSFTKDGFKIEGYIPSSDEEKFKIIFDGVQNVNVRITPADKKTNTDAPTKLKNGWFAKPFEMFVEMYGLPAYNDFDPTTLFAITYSLLFGIMFGDLGQGLVFVVLGYVLSKFCKMPLGGVISRVGLFSSFFGFWYGSVFGNEELLDPVFHKMGFSGKPIHVMEPKTTSQILIFAIGMGVCFIILSILVNTILGIKHKDYERAIFGNNGLAGMVLYGYVVSAAGLKLGMGINILKPLYIVLFVAIPLVLIFLKEPLGEICKGKKPHFEDGIGGFLTIGIFELFEVILSFVTNTMSFLRVGGFVLSHAGMMLVVYTLMDMVGGAGSILVLVFGNIFVMALEGFIVGIQALRLEFYEMFSRYYSGDGVPFTPISISESSNVILND